MKVKTREHGKTYYSEDKTNQSIPGKAYYIEDRIEDLENKVENFEHIKELEKPYNQIIKLLNKIDSVELQWVIKKCYALLAED